jgi:phosphoglycolate phosphatase
MTELRHSSTHLVVFDLDGTLVDSRRDIADSANDTLVAYGAGPLSEEAIGRMVGDGAPVLVARAFAAAGAEKPADALDRFLTIYDERLLDHTKPYPGIPNVLSELGTRARLAVLTNKPLEPTRRILDGLDLTRHFGPNWVVAGNGPFARKPDPTGLRHLIASAGTSASATVLVGDSAIDWQTGLRANVKVCVARYGFGGDGFVESLPADAWAIDSPGELLDHL